jgi:hypothetical protein
MDVAVCQRCRNPLTELEAQQQWSCTACLALLPGEEAARISMTNSAILAFLRQHFSASDATSLAPNIRPASERVARVVHASVLPRYEDILLLCEVGERWSDGHGFVATADRLCWKAQSETPRMIEWGQWDPERMYADGDRLVLGDTGLLLPDDTALAETCERAFHVLAFSARTSRASGIAKSKKPGIANATPPPPHAVTYDSYLVHARSQRGPTFACWRCQTPLYWNTPQCSHCNALPSTHGWRRTA